MIEQQQFNSLESVIMICKPRWRRKFRLRVFLIGIAALYLCTFVVIMPRTCRNLGYSSYFVNNGAEEDLMQMNLMRLRQSMDYLKTYENFDEISKRKEQAALTVCVSILTTNRYVESGYLIQTVAKLAKEVRNSSIKFDMKIVNAAVPPEGNTQVVRLKEMHAGSELISHDRKAHRSLIKKDKYDKHRFDLIKALRICNDEGKYGYALVLEDDAFAGDNFAYMFDHLIRRLSNHDSLGYVKLYHPEKWQGFGYDTKLELVLIVVVCLSVFFIASVLFVGTKDLTVKTIAINLLIAVLLTGYVVVFCYTFSRQHLLEILKYWRYTHFIVNAPGCCTSAVLYPTRVLSEFINFLETEVKCSDNYPIDLVPYDYFKSRELARLQVIPNLFYHIGYFSSVQQSTKHPREFFHLFPAHF